MASQITHIVLTEKVFDNLLSKFDHRAFILGTSLPDIRYFSNAADRSDTHYDSAQLPMVLNEPDSFRAGIIFHSVVDLARVGYMKEAGIYTNFALTDIDERALKFFEDKILYDKISNWSLIDGYFNNLRTAELNSTFINPDNVADWYKLLQDYARQKPTTAIREALFNQIGLPEQVFLECERKIAEFEKKPELIKIINNFYDNFENLIS